jgi:SsrA-binding protein
MSNKKDPNNIAYNKKANFSYQIEETFEAGMILQGWMVKTLRQKKVEIDKNVYIQIINGDAYIVGLDLKPLSTNSTHEKIEPQNNIKLLLHKRQITTLVEKKERDGYTIILTDIYFKKQLIKCTVAIAKGKNNYDKRQTIKDRDLKKEASRAIKKHL